jgi:hypothetical protein
LHATLQRLARQRWQKELQQPHLAFHVCIPQDDGVTSHTGASLHMHVTSNQHIASNAGVTTTDTGIAKHCNV